VLTKVEQINVKLILKDSLTKPRL